MTISKAYVQSLLQKHMPKLGDALITCTFTSFDSGVGTYDATTDVMTDPSTAFSIEIVFADFSFTKSQSGWKETNETVLDRDKKGIVITSQFPTGQKPKKDDKLTVAVATKDMAVGDVFNVVGANVDPYDGAYLLHLRPQDDV